MKVSEPLNALFYSPPGHGKTVLLGSAAGDKRLCPMLFLDFEGGTRSIRSKIRYIEIKDLPTAKPTVDKIDVIAIHDWDDFSRIYNYLAEDSHPYKSVAIDSLTEVNYLNATEALALAVRLDSKHDADIMEQRDYLRSASQMRKLVRFFRDLPLHVFLTANSQLLQDPRTREMKAWPSLTGKLAYEIPGLVTVVGYLALVDGDGDQTHRWLFVQPSNRFEAKDRSEGGLLGQYVTEPTLPKILDLLEGKGK